MDNEQLVARIRAGENTAENMLILWKQNKGFIAKLAKRYSGYAEIEDLLQEGYIGLCNAVNKYDLEADYKFLTCASFYIRRAMNLCILHSQPVKIPGEWNTKLNKYNKFMDEHYKVAGCEPSAIRIRAFTHLDEEDVAKLKEIGKMRQIGSLDAPITKEDSETIGELIGSGENMEEDIINRLDKEKAWKNLLESIEALPENQRIVVKMKYIDGMKQKEIAEVLGVSVNTVNRCDHNATGRLRRQESRTWHRYYSTIYLKAAVGHHVGVKAFQNTWTSEVEREALRRIERQEERKRDKGECEKFIIDRQRPHDQDNAREIPKMKI